MESRWVLSAFRGREVGTWSFELRDCEDDVRREAELWIQMGWRMWCWRQIREEKWETGWTDSYQVVTKQHPGAFTGTNLDELLKATGKAKVVLTGYMVGLFILYYPILSRFTSHIIQFNLLPLRVLLVWTNTELQWKAHVCVSTTARQAAERGYDVIVVKDAIGDRDIPGMKAEALVEVSEVINGCLCSLKVDRGLWEIDLFRFWRDADDLAIQTVLAELADAFGTILDSRSIVWEVWVESEKRDLGASRATGGLMCRVQVRSIESNLKILWMRVHVFICCIKKYWLSLLNRGLILRPLWCWEFRPLRFNAEPWFCFASKSLSQSFPISGRLITDQGIHSLGLGDIGRVIIHSIAKNSPGLSLVVLLQRKSLAQDLEQYEDALSSLLTLCQIKSTRLP